MSRLFRRKARRRRLRVPVRYGIKRLDGRGFTMDLSRLGIGIKTNHVFPPGTEIVLRLEFNDHILTARGVVRWARRVPPLLINYTRCGMGIEFKMLSDLFQEYLNRWEEGDVDPFA